MGRQVRYAFGDLNPIPKRGNDDIIDMLSSPLVPPEAARRIVNGTAFSGQNGRFRGVVLRVESGESLPFDNGINLSMSREQLRRTTNFVKVKVRVPEIHQPLPDPKDYGDVSGPHHQIIDLYPTFVSENPETPKPAVGDIVWVTFGDINTFSDPIYLGLAHEAGKNDGNATVSGREAFNECAGQLPDIPGQSGSYDVLPFRENTYVKNGEIIWNTNNEKLVVPFEVIYRDASKDFGTFSRKQQIKKIVLHHSVTKTAGGTYNVLKADRNGTHFEVDADGSVYQYLNPSIYGTYHATGFNNDSIGIDITGPQPKMTNIQISNTVDLILVLCNKYNINPVPFVEYYDRNYKDKKDVSGVFGHVHLSPSGLKFDPYTPISADDKTKPNLWTAMKQLLKERSSLALEYGRTIVKNIADKVAVDNSPLSTTKDDSCNKRATPPETNNDTVVSGVTIKDTEQALESDL
jgi:hypothetical protein